MSKRNSFSVWLARQAHCGDKTGILARMVAGASDAPLYAFRPAKWKAWLKAELPGRDTDAIVETAFDEFAHCNAGLLAHIQ